MLQRAFYSTIAALLLSATLVQTAAAYLTDTQEGEVSVTDIYDPLNLALTLKDGTNSLNFFTNIRGSSNLTYEILLSGTFTGVGYNASGPAGDWRLKFNNNFEGAFATRDTASLFLNAVAPGVQVGSLTYEGGLSVLLGLPLPPGDTPAIGDVFRLVSTKEGRVLQVDCADGTTDCNSFNLILSQRLQHQGPYVGNKLDRSRTNGKCLDGDFNSCGSFTLTASGFNTPAAVPEPATLALIGLGLLGLGLSRRARA